MTVAAEILHFAYNRWYLVAVERFGLLSVAKCRNGLYITGTKKTDELNMTAILFFPVKKNTIDLDC